MLLPMSFVLILHNELSVQVDVCVRTFLKSLARNLFVCYALIIIIQQGKGYRMGEHLEIRALVKHTVCSSMT